MKNLRLQLLLLPLIMTGCLDIETLSSIHPDGSIDRQVELEGSSEKITRTSFNIPRNDTADWQFSVEELSKERQHYRATRHFESVAAMNESFLLNSSPLRIKIESRLELHHGLFLTRYAYQERLWADLPGPDLSMDPYLSQLELEKLKLVNTAVDTTLLDSVEQARLEERFEAYLSRRVYEDFLQEVQVGVQRAALEDVFKNMLEMHGDSLYADLETTNFYDENDVWQEILEKYMGHNSSQAIIDANPEGFEAFQERWQFFEEVLFNGYDLSIEMPGVLRQTNASDVRGNLAHWEPDAVNFFFGGVTLEAESSKVHLWALALTAAILLLTLIVTIGSWLRQRRVLMI